MLKIKQGKVSEPVFIETRKCGLPGVPAGCPPPPAHPLDWLMYWVPHMWERYPVECRNVPHDAVRAAVDELLDAAEHCYGFRVYLKDTFGRFYDTRGRIAAEAVRMSVRQARYLIQNKIPHREQAGICV